MDLVLLTISGTERLWQELEHLTHEHRPPVTEAIASAQENADLSENAEFHAAREQPGFIEGRSGELEDKLSRAEVIDSAKLDPGGKVVCSARVRLWEEAGDREVSYQIVGELEADIDQGLISHSSPLALALLGKMEGNEIEVDAPGGIQRYEILAVGYGNN